MAARALLLELLPFRTGLLPLRATCLSGKLLVSECKLTTQGQAGQVPIAKKPKAALATISAFPVARVDVCIGADWSLPDFASCAPFANVVIHTTSEWLDRPAFSASDMLRYQRRLDSAHLPTEGLTEEGFRHLRDTASLSLTQAISSTRLLFTSSSFQLLRGLRELRLSSFDTVGCLLSLEDLQPVAAQLHTLHVENCPGFTGGGTREFISYAAFASLQSLTVLHDWTWTLDFGSLPASLLRLSLSNVIVDDEDLQTDQSDEHKLMCNPLCQLSQLHVDLCIVNGLVWIANLPASLSSLRIGLQDGYVFTPDDAECLHRLKKIQHLTLGTDDENGLGFLKLHLFPELVSLTLRGPWSRAEDPITETFPRLATLCCNADTFSMEEVVKFMPCLTALTLTDDSSAPERAFLTSDIPSLLFLKPGLTEVNFHCTSEEAMRLCRILLTATSVYKEDSVQFWWKPCTVVDPGEWDPPAKVYVGWLPTDNFTMYSSGLFDVPEEAQPTGTSSSTAVKDRIGKWGIRIDGKKAMFAAYSTGAGSAAAV